MKKENQNPKLLCQWSSELLLRKLKTACIPTNIVSVGVHPTSPASVGCIKLELGGVGFIPYTVQEYIFSKIANDVESYMMKNYNLSLKCTHNCPPNYEGIPIDNTNYNLTIEPKTWSKEWFKSVDTYYKAKSYQAGGFAADDELPESEFQDICITNGYDYESFVMGYRDEMNMIIKNA